MKGRLKYDYREMIAALDETRGMVYLAADRIGCEADTIYNYAKRFKAVADAIQRHRQRTTDIAELKLYQAIQNGESWAIQFYLRTQARQRGYVERQEVTGADGGPIPVLFYLPQKASPPALEEGRAG